jgi:four helix bundle protein
MKKFDLEERLIDFSVMVLDLVEKLPSQPGAKHLGGQLMRSGTSPALNYGEAQSGESKQDFIHKMKICLKELRETFVNLKIIHRKKYLEAKDLTAIMDENNQLISIFVSSIATAERNKNG